MTTAVPELKKPGVEAGPKPPETGVDTPEISGEELARLLEMGQNTVAEDERRVEDLDQEIAALWAEINAGALEQGEAQRLLGEVKDGQKQVEQVVHGFAEQIPEQSEPALTPPPEIATLDLSQDTGEPSDIEAELLKAMAADQEAQASVSASLAMPEAAPVAAPQSITPEALTPAKTEVAPAIVPTEESREELLEKHATILAAAEKGKEEQVIEVLLPAEIKLDQARKMLLEAEKSDKSKTSIEYADALKEYQEARAEAVGGKVEAWLEEQIKLVEARAQEKSESKKWLGKGYDAYKKLGEWNLGALLKSDEKLRTKEDDTKTTRVLKGVGRFATRTISVRTALSGAMLGAGLYFGVGAAVGAAAIAGRRVFSGLGAGIGSYDLLKMFSDKRAAGEKGMRKNLTAEEADILTDEELVERMSHFEAHAALNGGKITENETYNILQDRLKERTLLADLDDLMMEKDSQLSAITAKGKAKDNKFKIAGAVIGTVVGSGGLYAIKDYFSGEGRAVELGPKNLEAAELPKPEVKAPEVSAEMELNLDDAPETPKAAIASAPEVVSTTDHFDYQGGNSVWQEIENQYAKRFPEFHDLPKGEQTYLIDQVKDKIAVGPDKFGLADMDKVTADQLKAVSWDEAFKDAKLESPNLSHEQIANIEGPKGHEPMAKAEISPAQSGEAGVVPESKSTFTPLEASAKTEIAIERPSIPVAETEPDLKIEDKIYTQPKVEMADIAPPPEVPAEESVLPLAEEAAPNTHAMESLEQAAAKEFWAPDKAKTFAYLNAEDIEILSKDPELVEARLAEFDSAAKRTTELLAKGEINKLPFFEQGQPVLGANGKMYIIEQYGKGKDQWYAWQVKEDGELDQVVNNRKGWFGTKAMDLFKGKELHDALGYAESKGATAVASVEKFINTDKNFTAKDWAEASKLKEWSSPDGKFEYAVFEGESEDMQLSADKALYDARLKNPAATLIKQTFENTDGHYKSKIIVRIPGAVSLVGRANGGQPPF
ncbi:MAG: hypothetical protein AAB880_01310 [Patescibacteria group bacterium]